MGHTEYFASRLSATTRRSGFCKKALRSNAGGHAWFGIGEGQGNQAHRQFETCFGRLFILSFPNGLRLTGGRERDIPAPGICWMTMLSRYGAEHGRSL